MVMKNTQKICLTVIFILAITSLANAAVLEVGPPGGGVGTLGDIHVYPFSTIQAAVNYAQPSDTILIHSGIYDEQVVVNKNLTLQGVDANVVIKPSSAAKLTGVFDGLSWDGTTKQIAAIIVANVPDGASVTLKTLKVDGQSVTEKPAGADYVAGIFYRETGGTIDTVTMANVTVGSTGTAVRGYGCYISAGTNPVSVEVKGSTITNFDKNGMEVMGDKLTADINNNTITGRGVLPNGDEVQNGVDVGGGAEATVNSNNISNLAYQPEQWWAGGILLIDHGGSGVANNNNITNCQMGIVIQDGSGTAQGNTVNGGTVGLLGLWAQYTKAGIHTVSFLGNTVSGAKDDIYYGYENAAVGAQSWDAGVSLTVTISDNQLTGPGATTATADGIIIGDLPDYAAGSIQATITNNTVSGWRSGIRLLSSVAAGSTISGNTITNNGTTDTGVHVDAAVNAANVTVNYNKIVGNLGGYGVYGVYNGDTVHILNAENNWWGGPNGPYHPVTNIGGLGNNGVSDNVDYDPWCTDETCGTTGTNPVRNITKGTTYDTIQGAVVDAGDNNIIEVAAGTYVEIGQIVIDKNLTITGAGAGSTVVKKNENTGDTGSGTNRGWFLVTAGNSLTLSDVTLDGDGRQICFAVLSYGTADVNACEIKNISWSAESYYGRGVCLYGGADNVVRNCSFSNIRRIGVFAFNSGVSAEIDGITYTGKGVGDFLDYGIELGNGAVAEIKNSTITDCNGVAYDGSISAGILVTTYFGDGTTGTITNNVLTKNSYGIAVGYDEDDTSVVVALYNNIWGNIEAGVDNIENANNAVDASYNWWGDMTGPSDPCGTVETDGSVCYDVSVIKNKDGLGNAVSENVIYCPWLLVPIISSDSPCPAGDLDGDCDVDFKDLEILANNWLEGTEL
jgi:parallel beta-helix repeat protein